LTKAAKSGVIAGSPRLSLTNGGNKSLFTHYGEHAYPTRTIFLRVLPVALEGSIDILLIAVMTK
jgi:hypothetical protein